MAPSFLKTSFLLASLATSAFSQTGTGTKCGGGVLCPEDKPCCSQYGECGVGAYCLGGCDPANSFLLESCVPAPVCQSKTYNFDDLNSIESNAKYLGDSSKADWVSSGTPLSYNGQLLLTMSEGSVGTLLASTHYVWYGKISARLSTSAGAGVVTAFILLGDSKDEIDFEFVGVDLDHVQTNFYSLGVTNYNNGANETVKSDVHMNMHDYVFDWQPDSITWSIDGTVVRTLKRSDTWNATSNRYSYPQTPSRVQLSLWPAGLSTNPKGTIEWGGGLVDWNSSYMTNTNPKYYYAAFDSVNIECYDPPSGANVDGDVSYIFTDRLLTNQSVQVTDKPTVLASLLGTGTNMSANYADAPQESEVATIPGVSGAGPGTNGQRGADNSTSGTGTSNEGGSTTTSGTGSTGFVQGNGGMSGAGQVVGSTEQALQGSLFAAIIAIIGLCVL